VLGDLDHALDHAFRHRLGARILRDDATAVPPIALTSDSASPTGTIGDIATITADFRQHYYGLVGAGSDGADGPPLITSGLSKSFSHDFPLHGTSLTYGPNNAILKNIKIYFDK
jgi:hypothetical protein